MFFFKGILSYSWCWKFKHTLTYSLTQKAHFLEISSCHWRRERLHKQDTEKNMNHKGKCWQISYINIYSYMAKDVLNTFKRKIINWQKIFATHIIIKNVNIQKYVLSIWNGQYSILFDLQKWQSLMILANTKSSPKSIRKKTTNPRGNRWTKDMNSQMRKAKWPIND